MGEAAERPYQQAVDHLAEAHAIRIGKELLETLTRTVGDWWLLEDRRQVERARERRSSPVAEVRCDRCLIFADGVMGHVDGAWKEIRVGTVRSEYGDRVVKSSTARLCDVETFGDDVWRNACRMGYRGAALTAFIADERPAVGGYLFKPFPSNRG